MKIFFFYPVYLAYPVILSQSLTTEEFTLHTLTTEEFTLHICKDTCYSA